MECITYRDGYKYQLHETYSVVVDIVPPQIIDADFIKLDAEGKLIICKGYAWDGPSGPTIDTLNFMRGSLVHDALYQLMREKYLDHDTFRDKADKILQKICLEDGMWSVRAWWVYQAVRIFGNPAADPAKDRPVIKAPKGN